MRLERSMGRAGFALGSPRERLRRVREKQKCLVVGEHRANAGDRARFCRLLFRIVAVLQPRKRHLALTGRPEPGALSRRGPRLPTCCAPRILIPPRAAAAVPSLEAQSIFRVCKWHVRTNVRREPWWKPLALRELLFERVGTPFDFVLLTDTDVVVSDLGVGIDAVAQELITSGRSLALGPWNPMQGSNTGVMLARRSPLEQESRRSDGACRCSSPRCSASAQRPLSGSSRCLRRACSRYAHAAALPARSACYRPL